VPFETPAEAAQAVLQQPGIDGLLLDNVSLRQAQGQGASLVAVGPALEGNAYVIAMPLRATTLQAQIGETLARLRADGTMAQLEDAWFGPVHLNTD
jgi:ABC-type amino acid transport substrate-binding protein